MRYEQNFVIKQINRNFALIQKTICDIQFQTWMSLSPPNLAHKVARYITGHIYTLGNAHYGGYAVQHTEKALGKYYVKKTFNNQERDDCN